MLQFDLNVEPRDSSSKQALRQLRRSHSIPCVAYGHNEKNRVFSVKEPEILKMLHTIGRENAIINIKVDKKELQTLVKNVQRNPRTNRINHIDFLILHKGEKIRVDVPVKLFGAPVGVKAGGVLEQLIRDVSIKCLPSNIPQHFEVEISGLDIGDSVHVKDIKLENAEMLTHPDETIVTIIAPKAAKAEETAEGAEEELKEPEVITEKKEEKEEE